jgi:hypothetical protein
MISQKKIEEALARSVCGGWDRTFLESVLERLSRGRGLSIKQKQTLGKVLARNTPEDQARHKNWQIDYEKEYRSDAMILAAYHVHQPYYGAMAQDILAGKAPERGKFLRMHDNKYSKKVLRESLQDPRFKVGDYVSPRTSFNSYKNCEFQADMTWASQNKIITSFQNRGAFVIKICSEIRSAAKGAKRYVVIPIGETVPITIEERFLKAAKPKGLN